jgi:ATP-dependent helicase/nuclease subunit A
MLEQANLKIYTASAGSGKTHAIVYEYLNLALENNDEFTKILAVTFTNKVAREMKHRIISTIFNISNSKYDAIAQEILITKNWSQAELTNRARLLFSTIIHNYSKFTICTIDSFLHKVVTNFDISLGFCSDFELELNTDNAIDYATRWIIDTVASNKDLKKWVLQFAEEKLYQEKNWDPTIDIAKMCKTLFTESQQASVEKADKSSIDGFLDFLNNTISHFENKLQTYGIQAMSAIKGIGLKTEDFAYGKSGVVGYLEKLSNLQIEDPTKRTITALDNPVAWYTKNSQSKESICSLLEAGLMHLLQDVFFFYEKNVLTYKSAKIVKRLFYMFGIKAQMEYALANYRRKTNAIFISDIASLAYDAISKYGIEGLVERFGQSYNSIFIDEFQDISSLQWSCFRSLIIDGIANKRSSIVVGDVKQSIYRWRNSDWRLLHSQIFSDIKDHSRLELDTNWRSKSNIVLFNNTFFSLASKLLAEHLLIGIDQIEDNMQLRSLLRVQANDVADIYKSVAQAVPPSQDLSDAGYVKIQFFSRGDNTTDPPWQELSIQKTIDTIESLQEDGFNPSDIAIIVRNHKEGTQILEAILARGSTTTAKPYCKYEAISSSSFCLGQNKWVNLIISAMKYMSNRDSKLHEYELKFFHNLCLNRQFVSPNSPPCKLNDGGDSVKENSSLHPKMESISPHWIPECSVMSTETLFDMDPEGLRKIYSLRELPLNAIIDELIDLFVITDESATPFVQKLIDLALEISNKEASLDSFIEWWDHAGSLHVLPGAEAMNAIKILTIHQSKGLQFEAVIVPFCNWEFDHSTIHAPILWCNGGDSDFFSTMSALPMVYSSRLKETVFSKSYYEEQIHTYLDNLNLLYVALTRSKQRLYIFSHRSSTDDIIRSISDLLCVTLKQQTLPTGNCFFTDWESFWKLGDDVLQIGAILPKKTVQSDNSLSQSVYPLRHIISHNNDSKINWLPLFQKYGSAIDPAKVQFGNIMHELLSHIASLEELSKAISELDSLIFTTQENKSNIRDTLESLRENEQIKNWFSGDWEHKIEATLMNSFGKIMRPDRVLLREDSIVVIDFKTGSKSLSQKQQVQEYAAAIVDMGYSKVAGYVVYLTNTVSVVSAN